ncbi:MAG: CDP-diacylglycerol--glycerol-3-phosphate 3-phosphatidyltransferase [Elusimicrobia bacterium]|nr:CDP-diacylglycerol--glycerol-3-phosphate 3-phosphatidyltransferase [Elusimicrobiota bacterium]
MNLPNKITILRILLVPLIVIGLIEHQTALVYVLMALCMATDFLDGLIARRTGQHTKLGAFLDPMADKLLLISVFMTLAFMRSIPMWTFIIVFSRDLLIVLGWFVIFLLTGSSHIEPRPLGKATTAVQMATAMVCIIPLPQATQVLLWITVAITAVSAIDYVIIGEKRLGMWN